MRTDCCPAQLAAVKSGAAQMFGVNLGSWLVPSCSTQYVSFSLRHHDPLYTSACIMRWHKRQSVTQG